MALKHLAILTILLTPSFGSAFHSEVDPNASERIVGGSNATIGQFPWMVSIRTPMGHRCGGSILNSKWILTAAHCVVGLLPRDLTAVVGSTHISSGGSSHQLSKIIIHEDYVGARMKNDVAVLELAEEIEFSDNVNPIELERKVIGEVDCVVSGWGRLEASGARPEVLQFISLKTVSVTRCQTYYPEGLVEDSEICTLTPEGEGACHGDSGSPLVVDRKQIGIVSWGYICGKGVPDVYTRVSSFVEWIEEAISK